MYVCRYAYSNKGFFLKMEILAHLYIGLNNIFFNEDERRMNVVLLIGAGCKYPG